MAVTPSNMLPLGTPAPRFCLPDTAGRTVDIEDFKDSQALLVIFMCNHCPFVKHVRQGLAEMTRDFQKMGVAVVGINANDVASYPEDSVENMAREAKSAGYSFPYLFDESQSVAKAYRAACTPDFFLFDRERKLAYRGQMDESRPNNGIPVTGADLRGAVDAVLKGHPTPKNQKPSIGCNIKWRSGNEPDYFKR